MNNTYTISAVSILSVMLIFNQWQINFIHHAMNGGGAPASADNLHKQLDLQTADAGWSGGIQELSHKLIAKGIPPVYGAQLQVSFDKAAEAIPKLARFEQDARRDKLTGDKLERYIGIGQSISCEFCCGARTMVFPDGRKACACAHSAAMRGIVAYLLDNYADSMTNEQILGEAAKWKSAFFPGPTINKYLAQNGQGGAAGLKEQVGGC